MRDASVVPVFHVLIAEEVQELASTRLLRVCRETLRHHFLFSVPSERTIHDLANGILETPSLRLPDVLFGLRVPSFKIESQGRSGLPLCSNLTTFHFFNHAVVSFLVPEILVIVPHMTVERIVRDDEQLVVRAVVEVYFLYFLWR